MRYEELVEKLKNEICSVMCTNQEEACLEVEDMIEKIEDEFELDIKVEYFEESEEDKGSEKDTESEEDMEIEEMEESKEEKEHEESEEKYEYEHEDLLCRLFDG